MKITDSAGLKRFFENDVNVAVYALVKRHAELSGMSKEEQRELEKQCEVVQCGSSLNGHTFYFMNEPGVTVRFSIYPEKNEHYHVAVYDQRGTIETYDTICFNNFVKYWNNIIVNLYDNGETLPKIEI